MFGNSPPILSIHRRCPRHKILISQPFCDRVTVLFTKHLYHRPSHPPSLGVLSTRYLWIRYIHGYATTRYVCVDRHISNLFNRVIAINVLQIFVERRSNPLKNKSFDGQEAVQKGDRGPKRREIRKSG